MESYELAKACCKALSDRKATDIIIVDVSDQTVVCSYFVIATGKSTTQVHALGENVDDRSSASSILTLFGRKDSGKDVGACSITATWSFMSLTKSRDCSIISNGSGIREKISSITSTKTK